MTASETWNVDTYSDSPYPIENNEVAVVAAGFENGLLIFGHLAAVDTSEGTLRWVGCGTDPVFQAENPDLWKRAEEAVRAAMLVL